MANSEHLELLEQGIEAWNQWREANPEEQPDLSNANLSKKDLSKANFSRTNLSEVNLSEADLSKAYLFEANLSKADLKKTNLIGVDLSKAHLWGVDLKGTNLAGTHLSEAYIRGADLSRANLTGANLRGACLSEANLSRADLSEANLSRVDLSKANLSRATLSRADLSETNLSEANLRGGDLSKGNLTRANLTGANLKGADLHEANFDRANVIGVQYTHRYTRKNMSKYGRIRVETCFGNPLFKKFAQDQVYLDEFKKVHRIWFALWWVSSKCGQSFGLLAFWTVLITCLFGITYAQYELPDSWLPYFHWIELPGWFSFLYDWYSPVFQNLSASTWFTPYYFSIVTLTTSGYGDVTPQNLTGEIWVTTEIILGYVLLGILISVFVNKIARRS
jgi:uncharacterized protein YjbI with pentapeptide repeats